MTSKCNSSLSVIFFFRGGSTKIHIRVATLTLVNRILAHTRKFRVEEEHFPVDQYVDTYSCNHLYVKLPAYKRNVTMASPRVILCVCYLQEIVAQSLEIFDCWPWCEISCPVCLRVTAIREEVVLFCGVGESLIIHGLQVTRWRGIYNVEGFICFVYIPGGYEQEVTIVKTN